MNERRRAIEALFERALELAPGERAGWLHAHAAPELAGEVAALLAAHERADGVLEADAARVAQSLVGTRGIDRRVGPYRILRELGRGGMGVVYLAERDDGQFHRRVAIKLLRNSPDAEELHERFLAERRILGALQHPNIAQLLDAGMSEGQLPYLVLEYVEGLPITTWCDRHRLSVRDRIALFMQACDAVHHAHRNLIIHRDLKPSNILVTADGTVKLLDFGIAKLVNPGFAAGGPVTRTQYRAMTPEYASPEQVRGDALTTASDVYTLGVVLYELLAGHRPYALAGLRPREVLDAICELAPERPSTRVARPATVPAEGGGTTELTPATIAAARDVSPERLRRVLDGDLDAIVLHALRKEPGRRYGSAELLRQDLERYRAGHAVHAHHDSRGYRLRKLLRRHRVEAAAAAIVAAALVTGYGASLWQASAARQAQARAESALAEAERSRREAEEVTGFVLALFEANDPQTALGDTITVRDLLERGITRAEALDAEPAVQARMLTTLGTVLQHLGEYARAQPLLERALAVRTAAYGADAADVAGSLTSLGVLLRVRQDYAGADSLLARAVTIYRAHHGDDDLRTAGALHHLGHVRHLRGDRAAADTLYAAALAVREARLEPSDPDVIATVQRRGILLRDDARYDEAESLLRRALELQQRSLGPDHPDVARSDILLASLHATRGDYRGAEALLREALRIRVHVFGEGHTEVATTLSMLAGALQFQGRLDEAEPLHRQALAIQRERLGPDHTDIAGALNSLALGVRARGDLEEAERLFREAAAMYRRVVGPAHTMTATTMRNIAATRAARGDSADAERIYRDVLDLRRAAYPPDHPYIASSLVDVARARLAAGDLAAAESLFLEVVTGFREPLGDDNDRLQAAYRGLLEISERLGRTEQAALYRARVR